MDRNRRMGSRALAQMKESTNVLRITQYYVTQVGWERGEVHYMHFFSFSCGACIFLCILTNVAYLSDKYKNNGYCNLPSIKNG